MLPPTRNATLPGNMAAPVRAVSSPRHIRLLGSVFMAAALVLFATIPALPNYYVRVADSILIYVLLGIGLNIVVGYAGLLDLGFVAFYAIGAYTYALLASPQFGLHLPFFAILLIAAMLGVMVGILLGVPVLRLRGDYLAIVTLGFGEIIRVIINNADSVTNGPKGIIRIDRPEIFGVRLSSPVDFYWLLLATCIVVAVIVWRLERSILGQAWSAIREDQDAAAGVGINTTRVKLAAFSISAAIGTVAGAIFASFQRFVSPESFTLQESVLIVMIIVIGGIGNILGIIAGAAVLVMLPELLRGYAEMRMLVLGLTMAALIIVRPQGIVPRSFGPEKLFSWMRRS
jgi:branched-chain amino acid transport system permease protein